MDRASYFKKVKGEYCLPVLCSSTKLSQIKFWKVYVRDNIIYRDTWIDDGKVTEFAPKIIKGKNIGRANETSNHDQALFEAYSLWLKKKDQGYSEDGEKTSPPLPMLANKYEERGKKYLDLPFAVSRKLDGIRMMAYWKDNEIVLLSRLGKPFLFLKRIRQQIENLLPKDMIFDGELYSHTLPFNVISGAVRTKKIPSEVDDELEYWIFDLVETNRGGYNERVNQLLKFEKDYNANIPPKYRRLKFLGYELVYRHEDVYRLHDKYVSEGYEGIICRNIHSPYKLKYRSNDLLKYKNFQDKEFKIVGTKEGAGREKGAILFTCELDNGETFDVRPRGGLEHRQEMWRHRDSYIGKPLTVRYQAIGSMEAPRFPVGIEVRDYE